MYLVAAGATDAPFLARRLLRFACLGSIHELPPIHKRILFRGRPAGGMAGQEYDIPIRLILRKKRMPIRT